MIRRKGTYEPCDPCCRSRDGIRTINGQYPDANREFGINAGEGVSIDPDGNGIRIGIRLASPMVFRGTVGTGGTVASLPTANSDNLGWTYVAVSSGSTPDTPPKSYETGDMLISNSVEWTVVPAGDDPVDWSQITGTPTTLAGYGITDAVTLNTVQNINSYKTFLQNVKLKNDTAYSSGTQYAKAIEFNTDSSGNRVGSVTAVRRDTNKADIYMEIRDPADGTSVRGSLRLQTDDATSTYMTGPTRTYSASNVNDIVTIGSLASNPSVIHATGNEVKTGTLTLGTGTANCIVIDGGLTNQIGRFTKKNGITNNTASLDIRLLNDNTAQLILLKNIGGTETSTVIATL